MRARKRKVDPMAQVSDAVLRPPARAKDALHPFHDRVAEMTPNGPRDRREAYQAGCPARVAEGLELVESRQRGKHPIVFTARQHLAAAAFCEVSHKVAAGNVKLSSFDGGAGGGGARASVSEAMLDAVQRHRRMVAAIGFAPVLQPRGATAQAGRRTIDRLTLMQAVVVNCEPASHVLARFGWQSQTRHLTALHVALGEALDAIADL